jgi:hypothetical protein
MFMNIPSELLTPSQERELEKVNAFYLQKEAEVGSATNHHKPSPHSPYF